MTNLSATTLAATVRRRVVEAEGVVSLELTDADGRDLPAFTAGSHIDLVLGPDLVRDYSLWNPPSERHRYCIAVLREPNSRGGSIAVHDRLREGDRVTISRPRNAFPLAQGARRSILLGGGIGITPILSMAARLAEEGAAFDLHYCAKSPSRAAFRDYVTASFGERARIHYSEVEGGRLEISSLLAARDPGTHLYVCGPERLIAATQAAAAAAGWLGANVHVEHFAASEPVSRSGDRAFDVVLKRSGVSVTVGAEETVAEALERVGVTVPVSCLQVVCGSCITDVVEGVPDHRDMFLTEEEHERNDQFTPCCSRARSETLVLDL